MDRPEKSFGSKMTAGGEREGHGAPGLQALKATHYFNLFGLLFPSLSIKPCAYPESPSAAKDESHSHGYVYRLLLKI